MRLKTILNRVEKRKAFVYSEAGMTTAGQIEFTLQPRLGSNPICSNCGKKGATYDHSTTRRFEFVPLCAIAVFFVYRMRRVNCQKFGVTTEQVPWACGNNQQTISYRIFLATWAKRLSWKETATILRMNSDSVYRAIQWVVRLGIIHRDLSGIESIGNNEIQYRRGHKYLTLVYQLDQGAKRLLCVSKDHTEGSLRGLFNTLAPETIAAIKHACTDMWPAYLKLLKECLSGALNILARFHIAKKFVETLGKV